tara:strand:- start:9114 stop:10655 length:1542 start_codon:yes stop_codon:yes gene_type:complete
VLSNRDYGGHDFEARDRSKERFQRLTGQRKERIRRDDFKDVHTGANALITLVNDPATLLEQIPERRPPKKGQKPQAKKNPTDFDPLAEECFQKLGMAHYAFIPKKAVLLACGESILDQVLAIDPLPLAQQVIQRMGRDFFIPLGRFVINHVLTHKHVHKIGRLIRGKYDQRHPSDWARFMLENLGENFFREFDVRCLHGFPDKRLKILIQAIEDGIGGTSSPELGHEAIRQMTGESVLSVGLQFLQELPLPAIQTFGDELHFEMESRLEDTGVAVLRMLTQYDLDYTCLHRFSEIDPNEEYVDDDFFDSIVDQLVYVYQQAGIQQELVWGMLDLFARKQMLDDSQQKVSSFAKDVLLQKGESLLGRTADKILESFADGSEMLFYQWFLSKGNRILLQLQRSGALEKEPFALLHEPLTPLVAARLSLYDMPMLGELSTWLTSNEKLDSVAKALLTPLGQSVIKSGKWEEPPKLKPLKGQKDPEEDAGRSLDPSAVRWKEHPPAHPPASPEDAEG